MQQISGADNGEWRVITNVDKTKVVHFRGKGTKQTESSFTISGTKLEIVDFYKYLGITLNYCLDMHTTSDQLAMASS